MKNKILLLTIFIFLSFFSSTVYGQCRTWVGLSDESELMEAYVHYRDCLKLNQYEKAFPYWEKVYKAAPDADTRKTNIYSDGVLLYTRKFSLTKRKKDKTEIVEMIKKLMLEKDRCYPGSDSILLSEEILNFMNG